MAGLQVWVVGAVKQEGMIPLGTFWGGHEPDQEGRDYEK